MKNTAAAAAFVATLLASAASAQPSTATKVEAEMEGQAQDAAEAKVDQRRRAGEVIRQMLPPEKVAAMEGAPGKRFGGEFSKLAFENAYVSLWARPGLALKERSILTIGILIGLGNERELRSHIGAGLRNGITRTELEEIIYHSTGYAGFPAASSALAIASEVFEQQSKVNSAD